LTSHRRAYFASLASRQLLRRLQPAQRRPPSPRTPFREFRFVRRSLARLLWSDSLELCRRYRSSFPKLMLFTLGPPKAPLLPAARFAARRLRALRLPHFNFVSLLFLLPCSSFLLPLYSVFKVQLPTLSRAPSPRASPSR
jgi:hypothetical protein